MTFGSVLSYFKRLGIDFHLAFIVLVSLFSYVRIIFLYDVCWDDNCWVLSLFSSNTLKEYLDTGFVELRRIPLGMVSYYLFLLLKMTDYAYYVYHALNLLTQVLTPCILYLLIVNVVKNEKLLALFIATVSIIYPVDVTLPLFIGLFYRFALLFSILSLYFTERALAIGPRFIYLFIALVLSVFSQYFFMEGVVAFELARWFIIGNIYFMKGLNKKIVIQKTAVYGLPFLVISIPLILYKLLYKPFGIYSGTYPIDYLFFLRWDMHLKAIKLFLGANYTYFIRDIIIKSDGAQYITVWSVVLAIFGAVLSYCLLERFSQASFAESFRKSIADTIKEEWEKNIKILFLGLLFIIPPVAMYELAGRVPDVGLDSRHGIIVQFGYAILWGIFFYAFFRHLCKSRRLGKAVLAFLMGLGIFCNNYNLDLAFASWRKQTDFWLAFSRRFPSLPENATVLLALDYFENYLVPVYDTEFDQQYDCELPFNLLYTKSRDSGKFISHTVIPVRGGDKLLDQLRICNNQNCKHELISYHHGKRIIDPKNLIIVGYDGRNVLVNREILHKHSIYDQLFDRNLPNLPITPVQYPLRNKLIGAF